MQPLEAFLPAAPTPTTPRPLPKAKCLPVSTFSDLHTTASLDPMECVYEGNEVSAGRFCDELNKCEYGWGDRLGRLHRFSDVRFGGLGRSEAVHDIASFPVIPCHHGDGSQFPVQGVGLKVGQRWLPVTLNGEQVLCGWKSGPKIDEGVWKSAVTEGPFGTYCWPTCPEWAWRDHETVIVRLELDGVQLLAYDARKSDAGTTLSTNAQ